MQASRRTAPLGGSAIIMDPYTGEILALANWPTFNPNTFARSDDDDAPQSRHPGPLRARVDVQDRHGVGGARRARDHARDAGRDQPGLHHVRRRKPIHDTHMYGLHPVHRRHRQVEQRRRDQSRDCSSAPSGWADTSAASASVRRSARTSAVRTAGIVWNSGAARSDSALASVSMGYQVGVTPLQMATAASSVANGGHAAGAARRARLHQERPPRRGAAQGDAADGHRRHGRHADDDHGAGRRARHREGGADSRATPSPARPAPRRS